jgi:hypothetical protein
LHANKQSSEGIIWRAHKECLFFFSKLLGKR